MSGRDLDYKIARMDLRPGDILVVKCDYNLLDEMAKKIKAHIGEAAPGHKIIVLDRNMELSVLSAAEIEKRAANEVVHEANL